jgi:hypothetical protein
MAECEYRTLTKSGEGAESKGDTFEDASAALMPALEDNITNNEVGADTLVSVSNSAAMATNMRSFDSDVWETGFCFLEPYSIVVEDVRTKMGVALKPAEKMEDEDEEGVDLYRRGFSLAYGTLTLLRDTRCIVSATEFWRLAEISAVGQPACGPSPMSSWKVVPSATSQIASLSSTRLNCDDFVCRLRLGFNE